MHQSPVWLLLGMVFLNSLSYAKNTKAFSTKGSLLICVNATLHTTKSICQDYELILLDKKFTSEWKMIIGDVAQDPSLMSIVFNDRAQSLLKRKACKSDSACLKKFYKNFLPTLEGKNSQDWIGHYSSSNGRLLIYAVQSRAHSHKWLVTLNTVEPTAGKWMCNTGTTIQTPTTNKKHLIVKMGHQNLELQRNKDNSIEVLDTPDLHVLEHYWCGENGSLSGVFWREEVK